VKASATWAAAPFAEASATRATGPLSFFEFWPGWLFYAPVVVQWIGLGLRHGSMMLPTAANPAIEGGGLCGESKISILDQAGPVARALIAPYAKLVTHAWNPNADLAAAEAAMRAAHLRFPVVAKPDIGCNGSGVRVTNDRCDLFRYLKAFPRREAVMLQALVPDEGEAGIFYLRPPGESQGRITSLTLKCQPFVIGDGHSTLQQLILADPRAGRVPELYLPRLKHRLHEIPEPGARVRLVFVGNHCRGSIFRNGADTVTPALAACVDRIAHALPEFSFGRIDVRFESLEALRRGEDLKIIEINGVGSEPTHIWDPRTRLLEAWRSQLFHYGMAFRLGAANRARGHRPETLSTMFRLWQRQKRLMASYPLSD
jgi:hypothetical protein